MIRYSLSVLVLCLLWLTACANEPSLSDPTEVVAVMENERGEETAVTPSPVPTSSPTSTLAPSVTSTHTPVPTAAPTETATMTPTPVPTVTPPLMRIVLPSDPEDSEESGLEIVNQMGGAVTAVAVQDNLAYLGIGSRLAVADVSDPMKPSVISWSGVLPGVAEQIILRDELAYVALGEAGLWVFDISDPLALQPIGHVKTVNPARHFLLQDNLANVVDISGPLETEQFLSVVELSDPMQPVEISSLPLPIRSSKLVMVNGYLYIAIHPYHVGYEDTLWVVDVSDPIHPVLVTAVPELAGRDMELSHEGLVVAQDGSLTVADISDPAHPSKLSQSPYLVDYANINKILLNENVAFAMSLFGDAGYCGGIVYTFDISQKNNVRRLNDVNTNCGVYDMVIANELLYLATESGLSIVDISDPSSMSYIGKLPTILPFDQLDIGTDLYGTARYGNGFKIFDFKLNDPIKPHLMGEYEGDYLVNDVAVAGAHIYLATYWQGIAKIDMTDPTNPEETAVTAYEYQAENSNNLVLSDDRLYASLNGNLGIFDPETLQWMGGDGEELYGHYNSFVVENNTLWMWARGSELQAMNVINPEQLEETGILNQEKGGQLWVADQGFVYYLTGRYCDPNGCYGEYALKVIDATNPDQMRTVASLPTAPEIKSVVLSGNLLVLVGDDIWLVDVSDPTQPYFVGYFPTPGYSRDAVVLDDLIYVADGAGGLLVLRIDELPQP